MELATSCSAMSLPTADKITSQQKLKMKLEPNDTWSVREQLCLASFANRSGDKNWVSGGRSLKPFVEPNRPSDWLSPRNCALQYNSLLEKAGAHKRKRGERHPSVGPNDGQVGETPGEIILKQLTQERIEELQKLLKKLRKDYQSTMKELELVQQGKLDDQLVNICKRIDEEKERKLNEEKAHEKWLEEREKKQQETKQSPKLVPRSPTKTAATSDLTDSETVTPSSLVGEQLKIEVESIENKASSSGSLQDLKGPPGTPTVPSTQPPTPSSPLLTSLLQSPTPSASSSCPKTPSSTSKPAFTQSPPTTISPGLKSLVSAAVSKEVPKQVATSPNSGTSAPTLTRLLEMPLSASGKQLPDIKTEEQVESSIVIEDSTTIQKELVDESQVQSAVSEERVEETVVLEASEDVSCSENVQQEVLIIESSSKKSVQGGDEEIEIETVTEIISETIQLETQESPKVEFVETIIEKSLEEETQKTVAEITREAEIESIESEEKSLSEAVPEPVVVPEIKIEPTEEEIVHEIEHKKGEEEQAELTEEKIENKIVETEDLSKGAEITTPKPTRRTPRGSRGKKTGTQDIESTPEEKSKLAEPGPVTRRTRKSTHAEDLESEIAEEPTETVPNIGKKKPSLPPLYVASSSPAPSSGIESIPNSPTSSVSTTTEDDRDYRTWKKSILLVWREISSHKNASLFAKPVTEEAVPGYHSLVMRPMDLGTIKKNIESGAVRSTTEFQRDISLMFFNSIMYNPNYHEVNRLAREMYAESSNIIQEFTNAQLLAAHNMESARPQRRETRDLARRTESLSSHEDTPSKSEETKVTRASKRASTVAQVDDATSAAKTKRRSRAHPSE